VPEISKTMGTQMPAMKRKKEKEKKKEEMKKIAYAL
jgi:hypothetical protein